MTFARIVFDQLAAATRCVTRAEFDRSLLPLLEATGSCWLFYGVGSFTHGRFDLLQGHLVGAVDGRLTAALESTLPAVIVQSVRTQRAHLVGSTNLQSSLAGELVADEIGCVRVCTVKDIHGPAVGFFAFALAGTPHEEAALLLDLMAPSLHVAQARLARSERRLNARRSMPPITPREGEVLRWIALGKTDKQIALLLDKSVFTVKNQVRRLLEKYGVSKRSQAVAIAEQQSLLHAYDPLVDPGQREAGADRAA
ncbi:hypothetical protein BH10PSE17_BH10PSE17_38130 [soil metagenome]